MHVNRGLIGGLVGVHVSSIVKWDYQGCFKSDLFFLRKDFVQEHSQANINQQNKK